MCPTTTRSPSPSSRPSSTARSSRTLRRHRAARAFCDAFFDYYNHHHRHSGIGLHTPADVHLGRRAVRAQRRSSSTPPTPPTPTIPPANRAHHASPRQHGSTHPRRLARGREAAVALMGTINLAVARGWSPTSRMLDRHRRAGAATASAPSTTGSSGRPGLRPSRAPGPRAHRSPDRGATPPAGPLFEAGRLTEDAMVCIARRVPAVARRRGGRVGPGVLVSQLRRALASCPRAPRPGSLMRLPPSPPGGSASWSRAHPTRRLAEEASSAFQRRRPRGVEPASPPHTTPEHHDRQGLEPDADLDGVHRHGTR